MRIIADTNIWLRLADDHSAQHQETQECLVKLVTNGARIYMVPQNIVEFWAVATRPEIANGLGWTIERAGHEVRRLRNQFQLLAENQGVFDKWWEALESLQISGKQVHDARLAAHLFVHGVPNLLTFNDLHFRRFSWFNILRPRDVLNG